MWELGFLRNLQSMASPLWDLFFLTITMTAEVLPLGICTWLYWCEDRKKGAYLGYLLFSSMTMGNALKDVFQMPRPVGQAGIVSHHLETATGYSFPSMHTQTAATLAAAAATLWQQKYREILAITYVILVGFSRMYLGVHYPKDVIAGAVLGGLVVFLGQRLWKKEANHNRLIWMTGVVLTIGLIWGKSQDYFSSLGVYWGFYLGLLLHQRWGEEMPPLTIGKKWLKVGLGLIYMGILYGILGWLPSGNFFSFLQYAGMGCFGMGVYPLLWERGERRKESRKKNKMG